MRPKMTVAAALLCAALAACGKQVQPPTAQAPATAVTVPAATDSGPGQSSSAQTRPPGAGAPTSGSVPPPPASTETALAQNVDRQLSSSAGAALRDNLGALFPESGHETAAGGTPGTTSGTTSGTTTGTTAATTPATTAAATSAAPPPAEPADHPVGALRLSSDVIKPDASATLTAAVSLTRTREQLIQLLQQQQAAVAAGPGQTTQVASQLVASTWQYAQLDAQIDCPAFLSCDTRPHRLNFDRDLMLWNWRISAPDARQRDSGTIVVRLLGFRSADATQGEDIASLPPLSVAVRVDCGLQCVQQHVEQTGSLFKTLGDAIGSLQGMLTAAAALLALIAGWIWRRKRAGSKGDAGAGGEP